MKKFLKNNLKVFVLAVLTIAMGFTVFTSNTFKPTTKSTKVSSDDSKEGYNYSYNNDNNEYYYYVDEEGNYRYERLNNKNDDNNYYYEDENGNYFYENQYNDNIDNYENYYENNTINNNNNNNSINKNRLPSVSYNRSIMLNLFENFDPYQIVKSNGNVKITYNNVDNTKVGNYTIQYEVCNPYNDTLCRHFSVSVWVRDWDKEYTNYAEYDSTKASNVRWSNADVKKCSVGSNKCSIYNIDLPTATDPYTNQVVPVRIVSENINVNRAGVYYIVYEATSLHGITSTQTRQVQIVDNNDKSSSSTYNNKIKTKTITNHEWKNVVTHQYKCTNDTVKGASAWQYDKKLTNDDHSTYYYNQNGYQGILNKVNFYELNPYQGADIREQLGNCSYYGQTKTLTRTWIGIYSGTVTNYGNY